MQRPRVTHNALYLLDATFEIIKSPFIEKKRGVVEADSLHGVTFFSLPVNVRWLLGSLLINLRGEIRPNQG